MIIRTNWTIVYVTVRDICAVAIALFPFVTVLDVVIIVIGVIVIVVCLV